MLGVAVLAASTALRGPCTAGPVGSSEVTDPDLAASWRRPSGPFDWLHVTERLRPFVRSPQGLPSLWQRRLAWPDGLASILGSAEGTPSPTGLPGSVQEYGLHPPCFSPEPPAATAAQSANSSGSESRCGSVVAPDT